MTKVRWAGVLVVLALLASGCGGDDDGGGAGGGDAADGSGGGEVAAGEVVEVRADVERATPDATGVPALVDGDTEFALDLYRELVADDPEANLFLSPYSISVALAMTLAGAEGETASQMATMLRSTDDEAWHAARNALDQELLRERDVIPGLDPLQLTIANSIWGQAGYPFRDDFVDLLARDYGAGLRTVDFIEEPDAARVAINDWVEAATEERIVDLLAEGTIDELTRLVLVNAIYFKANWINQFDPERTIDRPFRTAAGPEVTVPTMSGSVRTNYADGDDWAAASLPYAGEASMLLIAPTDGDLAGLAAGLDADLLDEIRSSLSDHMVDLRMPRFEMSTQVSLPDVLERLGMVDAFIPPGPDSGADLTGMTDVRELFVSDVVHQADITVDEEGTEAAAATAIMVGIASAPPPATLHLDRPFILVIQDDRTGAILFIGQVADPS